MTSSEFEHHRDPLLPQETSIHQQFTFWDKVSFHLHRQTITFNYAVKNYSGKFEVLRAETDSQAAEFGNENAQLTI